MKVSNLSSKRRFFSFGKKEWGALIPELNCVELKLLPSEISSRLPWLPDIVFQEEAQHSLLQGTGFGRNLHLLEKDKHISIAEFDDIYEIKEAVLLDEIAGERLYNSSIELAETSARFILQNKSGLNFDKSYKNELEDILGIKEPQPSKKKDYEEVKKRLLNETGKGNEKIYDDLDWVRREFSQHLPQFILMMTFDIPYILSPFPCSQKFGNIPSSAFRVNIDFKKRFDKIIRVLKKIDAKESLKKSSVVEKIENSYSKRGQEKTSGKHLKDRLEALNEIRKEIFKEEGIEIGFDTRFEMEFSILDSPSGDTSGNRLPQILDKVNKEQGEIEKAKAESDLFRFALFTLQTFVGGVLLQSKKSNQKTLSLSPFMPDNIKKRWLDFFIKSDLTEQLLDTNSEAVHCPLRAFCKEKCRTCEVKKKVVDRYDKMASEFRSLEFSFLENRLKKHREKSKKKRKEM